MGYGDAKIVKNSIFLKVEQGSPHTVRLLDAAPTEQWQHKIGEKLVSCAGVICSNCAEGHSRNQRFVTNAFDHTDNKVVLWSYASTIAEALKTIDKSLAKDEESILDHDLEVSAQGSGMQKKTSIQLRLKSQPIPAGLKLHKIGSSEIPF